MWTVSELDLFGVRQGVMYMADIIIVAIVLVMVLAAASYIVKAKKSGAKCIGCSAAGGCAHSHGTTGCGCGCGGSESSCGCTTDK